MLLVGGVLLLLGLFAFKSTSTAALATSAEPAVAGQVPQQTVEQRDSSLFWQKLHLAQEQPTPALRSLAVGRSFLGQPYVAGTLDGSQTEHLIVNLRELDCWTSVENAVAIAATAEDPNPSFQTYLNYLRALRYWGGTVRGYGSRIHYFTGWILQAEKLGFVRDVTREMGGVRYDKKVSYMTDNPRFYPALRNADELRKITAAQNRINAHTWYYIPAEKIAAMEHLIQEGDLIILTSIRRNLDVEHQGFAVRQSDGRVHLLHASSMHKKVIIGAQPLASYVVKQPAMSGIMVVRVQ